MVLLAIREQKIEKVRYELLEPAFEFIASKFEYDCATIARIVQYNVARDKNL